MVTKQAITIYVGNLNYKRDEQKIKHLFSRYGYVKEVFLMKDQTTKQSKGFAFVIMPKLADATKAIEALDGKEIDGRTLKVSIAKERDDLIPSKKEQVIKEKVKKKNRPKKHGLEVLFNNLKK